MSTETISVYTIKYSDDRLAVAEQFRKVFEGEAQPDTTFSWEDEEEQ
jgi:hypothetical protein